MRSDGELVAAADENFVASFRKLARHVRGGEWFASSAVFAFVTGLPMSFFNGCVVTRPPPEGELEEALEWVAARSASFRVWIAERLARERTELLLSHGLVTEPVLFPGMTLRPPPNPPEPAKGVTVISVDARGVDEFLGVLVEGGLSMGVARRLFAPAFMADPGVALFVGRLHGRPVGTSVAIRSRKASGVYNVATLVSGRRRGVGSALTWAAVAAGRVWGRDTIVLQSSATAESMYRAMGFRRVAPYAVFTSPPGPARSFDPRA